MEKIVVFFALLSYSVLSYAMNENVQVGEIVFWHTRQYKITSRTKMPDSKIQITMERPSTILCQLPLATEQIMGTYTPGQNKWAAQFTQCHTLTPTSWVLLAGSFITIYKLAKYILN